MALVKFNKSATHAQAIAAGVDNIVYFPTDTNEVILNGKVVGQANSVTSVNGRTGAVVLGDASEKGIDTVLPENASNDSVPTSKAVRDVIDAIEIAKTEALVFAGVVDASTGKVGVMNTNVLNVPSGTLFENLTAAMGMRIGLVFKISVEGSKVAPTEPAEGVEANKTYMANNEISYFQIGDTIIVTEERNVDDEGGKAFVCSALQGNVDKAGLNKLGLVKTKSGSKLTIDTSGAIDISADYQNIVAKKADKPTSIAAGNLVQMDANGNLVNSGKSVSSFKLKQTAKSDPTAAGNSYSYIDTLAQDAEGVVTATKKTIPVVTASVNGLMTPEMLDAITWH